MVRERGGKSLLRYPDTPCLRPAFSYHAIGFAKLMATAFQKRRGSSGALASVLWSISGISLSIGLAACASIPRQSSPSRTTTAIAIVKGNNQEAPDATFLAQQLAVKVMGVGDIPLTNFPVLFDAGQDAGHLSASLEGTAVTMLTVNTDSNGMAYVWYAGPDQTGTTNLVKVAAGDASTAFTERTYVIDGTIAGPTGITQHVGNRNGEIVLNWVNHATNATYILVQQSVDDVHWVTIAKINDPTVNTYTAHEKDPFQNYWFGVIAAKP